MVLLEIKTAEPDELPIAKATAYKWHSLKRYPRLIFKVGGILFFDMDEWMDMCKAAREENAKHSKHINRPLKE